MTRCCNADCWFEDSYEPNPEQPCWGEALTVDEFGGDGDWSWIISCEGHQDMYHNRNAPYKHEPPQPV